MTTPTDRQRALVDAIDLQSQFTHALALVTDIRRTMVAHELAMGEYATDCAAMLRRLKAQYDADDCNEQMYVAWDDITDLVKAAHVRAIAKVMDITELRDAINAEHGFYDRRLHRAIAAMNDDAAR